MASIVVTRLHLSVTKAALLNKQPHVTQLKTKFPSPCFFKAATKTKQNLNIWHNLYHTYPGKYLSKQIRGSRISYNNLFSLILFPFT